MSRPLALAALLLATLAASATAQTAKLDTGQVSGIALNKQVLVYRGIPYASPPVGALRWQPPQPAAGWKGVRKANSFGTPCPQAPFPGTPAIKTSEDCLTLTVWRPAKPGRYPVLLWFFGGGFVGGDSSNPVNDGAALAKRGVIVVAANYRFGALGYMAHPALSAASRDHVSGNYGLLDQIAALKWVKANIAGFNGDPTQVTIGGQSSGGISVDMLMTSPSAAGLFARAIVQSAPITGLVPPLPSLEDAEAFGAAYTAARGANTLKELYALTPEQLITMSSGERALASPFRPTIDAHYLPNHPLRLFAAGGSAPVPLMIGSNAYESARITPMQPTSEEFEAWVERTYPQQTPMILDAYPHRDPVTIRAAWLAVKSDDMFSGTRRMARFHSRSGNPTFVYRFDREPPGPDQPRMRAFHGAELPYMFGNLDLGRAWTTADRTLSDRMMGYWVNFISAGDPNGPGLPPWTTYDLVEEREMTLDVEGGMIAIPHRARLAIFEAPVIR